MLWPICLVDCITGGETTTACTIYGHYETGTVTMYISADAMILNFRNPKQPTSCLKNTNIKIVGSASGRTMV